MKRVAEQQARHEKYMARFTPCPFCQGKDLSVELNGQATDWVRCNACGCTGPVADGENRAIERWNQREKKA